jgi:hypothetical protein
LVGAQQPQRLTLLLQQAQVGGLLNMPQVPEVIHRQAIHLGALRVGRANLQVIQVGVTYHLHRRLQAGVALLPAAAQMGIRTIAVAGKFLNDAIVGMRVIIFITNI